jgi:hypothetical protein
MTIHSLTVSIPEGKSSFKDRYELFRGFKHSPVVALFLSLVTFRKDRVKLADLFAKKLHHLARPTDKYYARFIVDWKTIQNGGDKADYRRKVQRLVVSSVLGDLDNRWSTGAWIRTFDGKEGSADMMEINAGHFLTLMTERFEVSEKKREITLKNLFNQIYQTPYHHPVMEASSFKPYYGARRIKDNRVDQVWRGVFLDSVKDLEDEPCVKKIYELQKLILKKICNSDASDQDDQTQFAEFEKYVKTQPRR